MKGKGTYKSAGVDIDAGNKFVDLIRPMVRKTFRPEVITDIGGFGGLFSFPAKKYKDPVLASSTDGVGTKLKVAFMVGKHDTVGIDLVAMCVNDIVVQGAEPLFLLDYLAFGKLSLEVSTQIIKGVAKGCKEAGCALIGGETAEMPSFYKEGEYDLAGFTVGVVERNKIIDGSAIRAGDQLIGIGSSGLHSNGYSLARKVFFEYMRLQPDSKVPGLSRTVGQELLVPTRIYVKPILNLLKDFHIHGIAHITGGGITDNLPRVIPKGCKAVIHKGSWPVYPIFRIIQEGGNIEEEEMLRTFNNGIGMILAVPFQEVEGIISRLKSMKEKAYHIGEIVKAKPKEKAIQYK
ncbi:MAG: phosphoribosylformylglycinamidine cyclo-ligase [Thermodesulfobacteriota bacterium]|nr:phosphoribosylformylglycinamidine cyclo-ligase [Thermodesulfobacteriota bacterium]